MTPAPEQLRQAVRSLAGCRREFEKVHAEYKAKSEEVYKQVASLAHLDEAAKHAMKDAETGLRALQLLHPDWKVDGCEITEGNAYDYGDAWAIRWAIRHKHMRFLKLDERKAFEKCAIASGDLMATKCKKVKISSDLSAYTEENDDALAV